MALDDTADVTIVAVPATGSVVGRDNETIALGQILTKTQILGLEFDPSRAWPMGSGGAFAYQYIDRSGSIQRDKVDIYVGWPKAKLRFADAIGKCITGLREHHQKLRGVIGCLLMDSIDLFNQEDRAISTRRNVNEYYEIVRMLVDQGEIEAALGQLDRYAGSDDKYKQEIRLRAYGLVASHLYTYDRQNSSELWNKASTILSSFNFEYASDVNKEVIKVDDWTFRAKVLSEWSYLAAKANDKTRSRQYFEKAHEFLTDIFREYRDYGGYDDRKVTSINNLLQVASLGADRTEFNALLLEFFSSEHDGLLENLIEYVGPSNGDLVESTVRSYAQTVNGVDDMNTYLTTLDHMHFSQENIRVFLKARAMTRMAVLDVHRGAKPTIWLDQLASLGDTYEDKQGAEAVALAYAATGDQEEAARRMAEVDNPQVVAWAIVGSFVKAKKAAEAIKYVKTLPQSFSSVGVKGIIRDLLEQNDDRAAYWFFGREHFVRQVGEECDVLSMMARLYMERGDYRHGEGALNMAAESCLGSVSPSSGSVLAFAVTLAESEYQ